MSGQFNLVPLHSGEHRGRGVDQFGPSTEEPRLNTDAANRRKDSKTN